MTTYNNTQKKGLSLPVCFGNRHFTLAVPYVALGAGHAFRNSGTFRSGSQGQQSFSQRDGRVASPAFRNSGTFRANSHGQHSFPHRFNRFGFFVRMDSTILAGMDSTSIFSRFNLHQAANRNLPKTASTFSHAG